MVYYLREPLTVRDKQRAAPVIRKWLGALYDERPTAPAEWARHFAKLQDVFRKTRPTRPVTIYRCPRGDEGPGEHRYDRWTSWSLDRHISFGFSGSCHQRRIQALVHPEDIEVTLEAFGPRIYREGMSEVILRPGTYLLSPSTGDFPPPPRLSERNHTDGPVDPRGFLQPSARATPRASNPTRSALGPLLSRQDMIARGADGYLTRAYELCVPLERVIGREPPPAPSDGAGDYVPGRPILQPIEVAYDAGQEGYLLYAGNHRVVQAETNGDTYIPAFVEPDGRDVGPDAKSCPPRAPAPEPAPPAHLAAWLQEAAVLDAPAELGEQRTDAGGRLWGLVEVPVGCLHPTQSSVHHTPVAGFRKRLREGERFADDIRPPNVLWDPGTHRFLITDGHHRVTAAREHGLVTIPVWLGVAKGDSLLVSLRASELKARFGSARRAFAEAAQAAARCAPPTKQLAKRRGNPATPPVTLEQAIEEGRRAPRTSVGPALRSPRGTWSVPVDVPVELVAPLGRGHGIRDVGRRLSGEERLDLLRRQRTWDPIEIAVTRAGEAHLIDGHHRLLVAAERGDPTIRVQWLFVEKPWW